MRAWAVLIVAAAVLGLAGPVRAGEPVVARLGYKKPPTEAFEYKVLKLALEKSGTPYRLEVAGQAMNEVRMRRYLMAPQKDLVTVAWFGTSARFERILRPVYIPIRQGLLGHRLFLIDKDRQPAFRKVDSVQGLRDLLALQGTGWADVEILRKAGLRVATAPQKRLYGMLVNDRGAYFPRGVGEAYAELAKYGDAHPDLAVEQSLTLIYPFAFLYFTAPEADRLHRAIRSGLEQAHRDGSYDRLFEQRFGDILARAKLGRRTRLAIDNPFMTDRLRQVPDKYWLKPGAYSGASQRAAEP